MKKRFKAEQTGKILQEAKEGLILEALCRKYAIALSTFY